jgi:hypothetical protein
MKNDPLVQKIVEVADIRVKEINRDIEEFFNQKLVKVYSKRLYFLHRFKLLNRIYLFFNGIRLQRINYIREGKITARIINVKKEKIITQKDFYLIKI